MQPFHELPPPQEIMVWGNLLWANLPQMLFYNHKCLLMTILHSQSSLVTKYFVIIKTRSACLVASVVSDSVILWAVAHQASLSMEFSRQEYWSGLPFPSPICYLHRKLSHCSSFRLRWVQHNGETQTPWLVKPMTKTSTLNLNFDLQIERTVTWSLDTYQCQS